MFSGFQGLSDDLFMSGCRRQIYNHFNLGICHHLFYGTCDKAVLFSLFLRFVHMPGADCFDTEIFEFACHIPEIDVADFSCADNAYAHGIFHDMHSLINPL